ITLGCAPDRYCPSETVRRDQMATFLRRALRLPRPDQRHFSDTGGNSHDANIHAVYEAGITKGCGGTRYCPGEQVTRAQMATFLFRALGLAPPSAHHFADVDPSSTHAAAINALFEAGISQGCEIQGDQRHFCPGDPVTRAEMASFLSRSFDL
ncbi:MAG: S-layer homology domain-containing protein, partial [Nitriliruptorales bacterium]|nr:S-layer homology domain-containing protein [Nitriliruptorales bacterium]